MKTIVPALLLACAAGLASPARADLDLSIAAEIRLGKAPPPRPPEIIVVEEVRPKGPPPWAPASGFRRNRAYYYYPSAHVYYRPADRMWFYLDGRDWRFGVSLPSSVRIDFDRSVSLTMETDRPYDHHRHVLEYYPGDYFARVQIKGAKDKDRGRDDDHPGKGKGKGKRK